MWQAYRLVYKLQSNLLIGWHTLGYINRTRFYITGKNMWASFTDNLTRSQKDSSGLAGYTTNGDILKEKVLLSYFYPAVKLDEPLLPQYTKDGLFYGHQTVEEFEKKYVSSFGKTAILPESNAKEDESLHEMEFMTSGVDGQSLNFVGYLFVQNKTEIDGVAVDEKYIRDIFSEIFVGGERKYGWGRLALAEIVEDKIFFKHELILTEDKPVLKIKKDTFLPAHTPVREDIPFKGSIETFVGRDWGDVVDGKGVRMFGSGRKISDAKLCWEPGSQFCGEVKEFPIGEYAILKSA
jgi:hypothetical protein